MYPPLFSQADTSDPQRLLFTEINHYVAHLRPLLVPWFAAFLIAGWLVRDTVSPWFLLPWMLAYLALFCFRVVSLTRFARQNSATRQERLQYWRKLLEGSSVLHGSFWGIFVWMALPELPLFRQFMLTWIVMAAGALAAVSIPASAVSLRRYLMTTMVPTGAAWFVYGGPGGMWMTLTLMILFFVYGGVGKRYGREVRERFAFSVELASANELLEKSNLSKTRFIVEASHDLRQPVHTLGMMLDRVDIDSPRTEIAHRLQEVQVCVDNVSDMLVDMLDLARLENGEYVVDLQPVSLGKLLRELDQAYGPLAQRKGLAWVLMHSSAWVLSDASILRRVMNNLITNAIKYTSSGMVGISCHDEGGILRVLVSDTGSGIPTDKLDFIFQEYVRLDDARHEPGHGIGLAVVKRMAQLLGHPMTVQSEMGKGSHFRLELVTVPGPRLDVLETPPHTKDPKPWLGMLFVFIENDEQLRTSTAEVLASWGAQVVAVAKVSEVLDSPTLDSRRPDLLICDMHLGGEPNGLEAIDTMRKKYPTLALPAILLTGDLSAELQAETRARDIRIAYKPVRPSVFRELIASALAPGVPQS